jgi:hypothetical protein
MALLRSLLVLAVFVCIPIGVHAHSYGSFYEETVGPYLVDIGYDPPEPTTQGRLLFDLNLFEAGDKTSPVEFSSVWVRLEHNGDILLAGPIAKMPLGPTTLVVRVPERGGELVVHARFEDGSTVLAEVSFPLLVTEAPSDGTAWQIFALAGGALLLVGAALLLRRGVGAA